MLLKTMAKRFDLSCNLAFDGQSYFFLPRRPLKIEK
jgi:hypothetical protein